MFRALLVAAVLSFAINLSARAQYHLERISAVINQPNYITQAPGDPTNIIYFTTRMNATNSSRMGRICRYDVATRASTPVLDLSSRSICCDDGLQCIAFHPNFNLPGSNGYGKLYVSSAELAGTGPTNRVEEYFLNPANPASGAVFTRLILQYVGNGLNNHTADWLGFDPNATNEARHYLYISTGDGAYGNSYGGGVFPGGRPAQNPADVRGKILRVDISGPDDYPADTNKNFAIPPSNPIPVYNANTNHSLISGLGEVFVTGLRNSYRMSFDRATSDLYWADVGESSYEEINFLKAGSSAAGPPADFGWPQSEGVHDSGISGAPHSSVNPFTGVTSTRPLREYSHVVGQAATGGYLYRGPIRELQGKYIFADFVAARIWMLEFDRNNAPASFNGANGTLTELTTLWSTNILDRSNAAYAGDINIATVNGLDHVVSFGEDNLGNLYVVDFSFGNGFAGQYSMNGGELIKLVSDAPPPPVLSWTNLGTNLKLSWTDSSCKLQIQTNALGDDWIDYPNGGTSPATVPHDAVAGAVFFRLKSK
jgi:glucose/arabinose dehydrogenase